MKVLFISAVLPWPLHSGGQVRMYNLLKSLSEKHEITLASFIRSDSERELAVHLPFVKKILFSYRGTVRQPRYAVRGLLGSYPLLLASYDNAGMKRLLTEELSSHRYDLIHEEPFYVMPSVPDMKIPVVVGEHNIEYEVYDAYVDRFGFAPLKPLMRRDTSKMKRWEYTSWKRASSVITVSEHDYGVVEASGMSAKTVLAPNGVDTDGFWYRVPHGNPQAPRFLFVGNFAWFPNKTAVDHILSEIWPSIRTGRPRATLTVIGKNMPAAWKNNGAGGVVFRRDVPDIREAFADADALLAPIRIGGGSKFKLLEAMASGIPVITYPEGAAGLDVTPDRDLFVADSSRGIVRAALSFADNPEKLHTMTKNARTVVEKKYGWKRIAAIVSSAWEESAS